MFEQTGCEPVESPVVAAAELAVTELALGELSAAGDADAAAAGMGELDVSALAGFARALGGLSSGGGDAARIDRIRVLTELESAVGAARMRQAVLFAASQRAGQLAVGIPAQRAGRGIAAQVGLAMRVSPARAERYLSAATVLVRQMPGTFAAVQDGRVSQWRAMLVARETTGLSVEDRGKVDTALAPLLEHLGDRGVEAETRRHAYRLDPHAFGQRARLAVNDRRVTLRPAPDTMTRLTALLPVAQGVAVYAALTRAADTTTATGHTEGSDGSPRGRGQLMADTLVQRITGTSNADQVPVEIALIMPAQTLLDPTSTEPAHIDGYGPIPAALARDLALNHTETPAWLRRLYTHPQSGELVTMESTRRTFTPTQRTFLRYRDQHCRTPWCDAPIRHGDHITPAAHGGPTTLTNGQGLCQHCNHTRQAPAWRAITTTTHGRHRVHITTPTGHRYPSRAPTLQPPEDRPG